MSKRLQVLAKALQEAHDASCLRSTLGLMPDHLRRKFAEVQNAYLCAIQAKISLTPSLLLKFRSCRQDRIQMEARFEEYGAGGQQTAWSFHQVVITPSFTRGFAIQVEGGVKELRTLVEHTLTSVLNEEALPFRPRIAMPRINTSALSHF